VHWGFVLEAEEKQLELCVTAFDKLAEKTLQWISRA
jgi:hypothetical protein